MTRAVSIAVPATTANLGPGFDCLSLALELWNTTRFRLEGHGIQVKVFGEGAGRLPVDESNLVASAALYLFRKTGKPFSGLRIECQNNIPLASGMGSSAAAVVSGLLGANALLATPYTLQQLLAFASELEGHADNAAAAFYGGLTIAAERDGEVIVHRVEPAPLLAVLAVPEYHLPTHQARAVLPKQLDYRDAVFNMGGALLTVEALRSGDMNLLGKVMTDRMHQPYRLKLIPGAEAAYQAALQAGAAAVALSGAGPSLVAFFAGGDVEVAAHAAHAAHASHAMQIAFEEHGLVTRSIVLPISLAGAHRVDQ
jgi:homoserine kinase